MHRDIEETIISKEGIHARVQELGKMIEEDYRGLLDDGVVFVGLLRGAAFFVTDLARAVNLPIVVDYMSVSSYGNAAVSSGKIDIKKDVDTDLAGKHVVIVEDMIDSGLTLTELVPILRERGAKSVEIAVLLKKENPKHEVDARYVGFDCPDGFIVGYGLDFADRYRNLPYIGALKEEIYS